MPFHFLKVSPTLRYTPKDAHPGLLQSRGAAGALLRLPDNPDYTKDPILPFSSLFLYSPKQESALQAARLPGLCMVSVGKAERDGSTSSGSAFTMELMDGFLDDTHSVARQ